MRFSPPHQSPRLALKQVGSQLARHVPLALSVGPVLLWVLLSMLCGGCGSGAPLEEAVDGGGGRDTRKKVFTPPGGPLTSCSQRPMYDGVACVPGTFGPCSSRGPECCCGVCHPTSGCRCEASGVISCWSGSLDACMAPQCGQGCKLGEWKTAAKDCQSCSAIGIALAAAVSETVTFLLSCTTVDDCVVMKVPQVCGRSMAVLVARQSTETLAATLPEAVTAFCPLDRYKKIGQQCRYQLSPSFGKIGCVDGRCISGGVCDPRLFPLGSPCDDKLGCTLNDVCVGAFNCAGKLKDCSDGDPCTDDSCDPQQGCVHSAPKPTCATGQACSLGGICAGTSCDDYGIRGFRAQLYGVFGPWSLGRELMVASTGTAVVVAPSTKGSIRLLHIKPGGSVNSVINAMQKEAGMLDAAVLPDDGVIIGRVDGLMRPLLTRLSATNGVTWNKKLPSSSALRVVVAPRLAASGVLSGIAFAMVSVVDGFGVRFGFTNVHGSLQGTGAKVITLSGWDLLPGHMAARVDGITALVTPWAASKAPRLVRLNDGGKLVVNQALTISKGARVVGLISAGQSGWLTAIRASQSVPNNTLMRIDDAGGTVWTQPIAGSIQSIVADGPNFLVHHYGTKLPIMHAFERFDPQGVSLGAVKIPQVVLGKPHAIAADGKGGFWLLEADNKARAVTHILAPCPPGGCAKDVCE